MHVQSTYDVVFTIDIMLCVFYCKGRTNPAEHSGSELHTKETGTDQPN